MKIDTMRTIPNRCVITPVAAMAMTINADTTMLASSNLVSLKEHRRGESIAARPMAIPMFTMLLPITLPMINDGASRLTMDVIASGDEEPKANTVNPMTNGEIPMIVAIFFAPSTIHSEPKYRRTIPIGIPSNAISITQ